MEGLVGGGAAAQFPGRLESDSVLVREPVAFGNEVTHPYRINEREGPARIQRKSPPQNGPQVSIHDVGQHAFFDLAIAEAEDLVPRRMPGRGPPLDPPVGGES